MIGAQIGDHVVAQSGDRAVVLDADFDCADLGAAVNRRLHIFAPRLNPLHRFAELHRDPSEQGFFRIDIQLRSKAAADFRGDHT